MAAIDDAERIAVIGDTHCDITWTERVVRYAAADGVTMLVQVGDFGYWPRMLSGPRFLDQLNDVLAEVGATMWFLRGNHEDQEVLLDLAVEEDGLVTIRDHIRFIPDGTVISWHGRRLLCVGGAPSIDADGRVPGYDWFPSEVLTRSGFDAAIDAGQVDMVLSHDCPAGVPLRNLYAWRPGDLHREVLGRIAESARPALWVHGHYHRRVTNHVRNRGAACQVESLSCNKTDRAVIYVAAGSLAVSEPQGWPTLNGTGDKGVIWL